MTIANSNKPAIDVMFDINTLSYDREKGIVLSVGFKTFSLSSPDAIPKLESYVVINPDSSLKAGRVKDDEIVKWWKHNSVLYREMKRDIRDFGQGFESGWKEIYRELKTLSDFYTLHVWSKDIEFQFPMIESSLRDAGLIHSEAELPYSSQNKFDVRTLLLISEISGGMKYEGINSNLDSFSNCTKQISLIEDAWKYIKLSNFSR